ncbi:MAG: hypothetical protein CMM10_15150 [Rhodospirillaceae bacterium]|nr:hypothetical protein [Rhodospirillaceae bacterium]
MGADQIFQWAWRGHSARATTYGGNKSMSSNNNAAEAIVEHLIDEGVKYVFGITGDTVLPIIDAIYDRQDEIHYITCRLEHGATGMADAYSRVTGEPACVLLHAGPGIANAVLGCPSSYKLEQLAI